MHKCLGPDAPDDDNDRRRDSCKRDPQTQRFSGVQQPRPHGSADSQDCMQVQKAERAIVRAVEADKTDVDVDQIVKDLQEKVGAALVA